MKKKNKKKRRLSDSIVDAILELILTLVIYAIGFIICLGIGKIFSIELDNLDLDSFGFIGFIFLVVIIAVISIMRAFIKRLKGKNKQITDESVVCLRRDKTVHEMKLNSTPFEMIKSGEKTIELRLFDEKRRLIKAGDRIVFANTATGEKLTKTVAKLHRFDSFDELYKSLPLLQCGYTSEDIERADPSDMERYYSVEAQKKYGVVGIELC